MLRMTKPGGLVIVTCACYGRPEHGTTRSEPKASPLMIRKGWDYYCNLSGNDFLQRVNLKNWFGDYQFFYNHICKDLYFIGVIKDAKQKKEYLNEFNNIQKKYQDWKNFIYRNMCCLLKKDISQNLLRLY